MELTQEKFNDLANYDVLKKHLKPDVLAKKSEEERFLHVVDALRKHNGFKYWMSKQNNKLSKSAKLSEEFRRLGNRVYASDEEHRLSRSIETFTMSVAYAPTGSTQMALAYANRSAVLFKARLYDDALLDVRRALRSGYPDRLKAKLFARRVLCLRALDLTDVDGALDSARRWLKKMDVKSSSRRWVEDVLDHPEKTLPPSRRQWNAERILGAPFEENPELVGVSSSVAMKQTQNREKQQWYAAAARDIKPGEIVAIQEPYVACLDVHRRYTNCCHCFRQTWSGIPCSYCVTVVYCSEECQSAAWADYHGVECRVLRTSSILSDQDCMIQVMSLRVLIRAAREAGSFEELERIVSKINAYPAEVRRKGYTGTIFNARSFESFYSLPRYASLRSSATHLEISYKCVHMAFLLATRSNFFGAEMSLRDFADDQWVAFVGGLLNRFFLILLTTLNVETTIDADGSPMDYRASVQPFYFRLPHSCCPNVSQNIFGRKTVIYAHYPLKAGEPLCGCLGSRFQAKSREDRQDYLRALFGFTCKCVACVENWPKSGEVDDWMEKGVPQEVFDDYCAMIKYFNLNRDLFWDGDFAVVAKAISDISRETCTWWQYVNPRAVQLTNFSALLFKIFMTMGSRHELF